MDWATYTIDFAQEGRRKVQLFSYVLGYSRRQYIHFTASQDLESTLREHARAFEHLGGAAATCLYDNMKVVVARYEDGEPIYNCDGPGLADSGGGDIMDPRKELFYGQETHAGCRGAIDAIRGSQALPG
jgi:hypothetical protein